MELGSLTNLRQLGLNGNQLSGEVPLKLGNLTNLQALNLAGNQLGGEIPMELALPFKAIDTTALASFAGLSVWCAASSSTIGEAPAGLLVCTGLSFGVMFMSWMYLGVKHQQRSRAPKPAR